MQKRQLTVSYLCTSSNKEVPFIRLQGKWLEAMGFNVGEKIEVRQENNTLVITKCNSKDK